MFYDFLNLTDDTIQLPETEYGIKALKKNSQIVYIPIDSSNVLITGVTGYGKTVFTKQYVHGILNKNPDTYAIFFQIKPDDFLNSFYVLKIRLLHLIVKYVMKKISLNGI